MTAPPSSSSSTLSVRTLAAVCAASVASGALAGVLLHQLLTRRNTGESNTPRDTTQHFEQCADDDRVAHAVGGKASKAGDSSVSSGLTFRDATVADIPALGQQWMDSYNESAALVGAPPMFTTLDSAIAFTHGFVPSKFGLVAVSADGELVGSAFNDESDVERGVVGCGPWTVTWRVVNRGVGRELIEAAVAQSLSRGARSLRLLASPSNMPAFTLYARLGFVTVETLTFFKGALPEQLIDEVLQQHPKWRVSEWTTEDVVQLAAVWQAGTGFSRVGALEAMAKANRRFKRLMLKDGDKVLAFTTGFGFMGSSCATSESAFLHLLCAGARLQKAEEDTRDVPPMMHVCTRLYPGLVRWLLAAGMRVMRNATVMVLGEWQPIDYERFVYCPSTELN